MKLLSPLQEDKSFLTSGLARCSFQRKKLYFEQCKKLYPFLSQVEQTVLIYRKIFQNKDYDAFLAWLKVQLNDKQSPFHSHSKALRKHLIMVYWKAM